MQFLGAVTFLAALLPLSSATPATSDSDARHFIKFVVDGGKYNNMEVTSYHTGAGLSVPVLSSEGAKFRFNGTQLNAYIDRLPYGLAYGTSEDLYAEWGPLTLDAGLGDDGWALNRFAQLVRKGKDNVFYGFRACEWVHGNLELYVDLLDDAYLPCNCQAVKLLSAAIAQES